jgi:4-amino-4-deoxy-L-arabinose transferase-like glycosyltransferase
MNDTTYSTTPPRADRRRRALGALPSRAWRSVRRTPRALVLLLLVGALQSLAWDVAVPAFQGPDENAHFAYVQYFAETGRFPSSSKGNSPYSTEVQEALDVLNLNSLMGNLEMKPGWSRADLSLWHGVERHFPAGAQSDGSGANPIAKNPPLYYILMAAPYRVFVWLPLLSRLFVMRLCSALCFLATIALTWKLAAELFPGARWKQALAAGVVALQPQLGFTSAIINADTLLITLTTAFLLAAVRLVIRGPTTRRVLLAGGLSAADVLTHGRGLVTVPVLLVALLVAWVRFRPGWVRALRDGAEAIGLVVAGVVFSFLAQRSAGGSSLYGGQASSLNSQAFGIRQFLSFAYQFFLPRLSFMTPRIGPAYGFRQVFINTFYGTFGWLEVSFRPGVYDLLQVGSVLGFGWLYTTLAVRFRALLRVWAPFVVLLTMLIVQIVFLLYVSDQALLGDGGTDPLIVGRYLLPIVSLFGLAIAYTIGSLPRRAGQLLAACLLSAETLLALGGIALTASRFYA